MISAAGTKAELVESPQFSACYILSTRLLYFALESGFCAIGYPGPISARAVLRILLFILLKGHQTNKIMCTFVIGDTALGYSSERHCWKQCRSRALRNRDVWGQLSMDGLCP